MIRVNTKILTVGIAMLVIGFLFVGYLSGVSPAGQAGMSEEEILELLQNEQQNADFVMLASIIIGVGFLFVLISFGTARGEGLSKTRKIKPAEPPN